ncbi:MAG: cation transporter [Clostridiales bacterium]|nr:cation transporter [Clostridiales bacterium]
MVSKKETQKNIKIAFFLNFIFTIVEIIGGILTNSISIMSDAIHDLGDSLSIGLAWILEKKSVEKPDEKFTYGYARYSLLGALINSLVLLTGSAIIIYRAIPRIIHPEEINKEGMILFAIVGIVVNGFAAWKTSKGEAINEKTVSLHLLEDVLGWVAVFVTSIIVYFTNWYILDGLLSILITIFILFNVGKNLKKIISIFLQKAPDNINFKKIEEEIVLKSNAIGIHHIHIWSLEGTNNYLTMHVVVNNNSTSDQIKVIKSDVKHILSHHKISHVTMEIEFEDENCQTIDCELEQNSNPHQYHNH